jgi:hypothetical protein
VNDTSNNQKMTDFNRKIKITANKLRIIRSNIGEIKINSEDCKSDTEY